MKIETHSLWNDGSTAHYISYLYDKEHTLPMVKLRPAIIICPGGGYLSTEYREGEPVAMHFLNKGYQAFVLHYHTKSTGADPRYPQPLFDIAKMMLLIREHAEQWNIDPKKIGVLGFSAGGSLCSILSTRWHSPLLREKFQVADSTLFRPTCAVLCYALTKERTFEKGGNPRPEIPDLLKPYAHLLDKLSSEMYKSFFGTEEPTPEQLRLLNTVVDVDERTPPTFLWTTAGDYMVDAANSLEYANRLLRHRVPVELHMFEKGPHGMSKGTKDAASIPDEVSPDAAQWLPLADRWMEKYMGL